jgi:hypothetical protein
MHVIDSGMVEWRKFEGEITVGANGCVSTCCLTQGGAPEVQRQYICMKCSISVQAR